MTPSTLYVKRGRKYVAVSDYDRRVFDAMPWGAHIVIAAPGKVTTRYGVNPFHAGLWAAFEAHRDQLAAWLMEAGRPMEAGRGILVWPAAATIVDDLLARMLKAKVEDAANLMVCGWTKKYRGFLENCQGRLSSAQSNYCPDCGRPVKVKEAKGKR